MSRTADLRRAVWVILRDGSPRSSVELVNELRTRFNIDTTTATATARARDLRKEKHGAHRVVTIWDGPACYYQIWPRARAVVALTTRG